jgi:putative Mg2+ transporter-C (MgtC) family protein
MVAGRGAFRLLVARRNVYRGGVTDGEWVAPAARLFAAAIAGGIIGWERQAMGRPAGLRTHMLVSLGSAIVVSMFGGISSDATSHVVQGVATGVGFLCAGDILHHVREGHEKITGLTSAASLWVTSTLGMAAALGKWGLTVVGTAGTLLTLTLVRKLERHVPTVPGAEGNDGDGGGAGTG